MSIVAAIFRSGEIRTTRLSSVKALMVALDSVAAKEGMLAMRRAGRPVFAINALMSVSPRLVSNVTITAWSLPIERDWARSGAIFCEPDEPPAHAIVIVKIAKSTAPLRIVLFVLIVVSPTKMSRDPIPRRHGIEQLMDRWNGGARRIGINSFDSNHLTLDSGRS